MRRGIGSTSCRSAPGAPDSFCASSGFLANLEEAKPALLFHGRSDPISFLCGPSGSYFNAHFEPPFDFIGNLLCSRRADKSSQTKRWRLPCGNLHLFQRVTLSSTEYCTSAAVLWINYLT